MIVAIALFLLLVSLPATIMLVALTIVGSALAATAEGTLVRSELPAGEASVQAQVSGQEDAA